MNPATIDSAVHALESARRAGWAKYYDELARHAQLKRELFEVPPGDTDEGGGAFWFVGEFAVVMGEDKQIWVVPCGGNSDTSHSISLSQRGACSLAAALLSAVKAKRPIQETA